MKYLLTVLCLAFLAGCNTVSGVGKDVAAGGDAISTASEKTAEKM